MAFKGAVQRWRKMRSRVVMALSRLYVGGSASENSVSALLKAAQSLGTETVEIANDGKHVLTATVTGAEVGNYVLVNLDADQERLNSGGYVDTANSVIAMLDNLTGDTVSIDPDTDIKILLFKP